MHVTCFGDFQVTFRGQKVGEPGWLSTKAGDLFAYFITFRDGTLPKDRVLEALWPEMRPDRSSGAFHTALYKMRHMLRVDGEQDKFVQAHGGEYALEKEHFWIDADEFSRLMTECSRHSHPALERCEACAARLQRAVALYQGDYLQNLYYDWVLDEQRHLQEEYLDALQVLAAHRAGRGDYETALAYGRQVLVKDPLLEEVHCQMMRYYGQLGDRSGLVRQHQQFSTVLADELGIEPMQETQQLYQALLSGQTA
jgi:two-component SAPR family response regulator